VAASGSDKHRSGAEAERPANETAGSLDPQKLAKELLDEIDDLLRNETSLEQEDRQTFAEHFNNALREVVDAGDYATIDTQSTLQDSVDQLKQYAAEIDDGTDGLVRQLNNALAPLERRETKIALEFSRRLDVDGQESALAWLREQQEADEQVVAGDDQPVPDGNPFQASRDEVTRSRSRRLRGPPTHK